MTQKDFVIKTLKETGEISRNYCLKNFISRLGAIMCDLKKEGWNFKTENTNGNYIYKLINSRPPQEMFTQKGNLEQVKKPYYEYNI